MRKVHIVCGLMLGATLTFAQDYRPNSGAQNDRSQNYQNDPNFQNGSNYRGYDQRNYANNRWSNLIPAGTEIAVRTDQTIDVRDRGNGRVYTGRVADDVRDTNGSVLIPRGADAELIVQDRRDHDMVLDLESISFGGRRYMVNAEAYDRYRGEGVGENRRTGEFVGGGAALGSILGAIAGGGKGAAIGALAGAAAGAGAQVATRGAAIAVPAETILTFRLEQALQLGTGRWSHDNGYDRDGYHYHDDYYHRDATPGVPPQR